MAAWVRQWWFAAVPAAAALVLGVWGVGAAGPWWDELYTISALTHGLGSRSGEVPLMPYYGLVWLWSGGGSARSIEWLRLLSGLSYAAGSVAVALAGRRLSTPRVGFAAAMFFVLAPGITRYAQEARVYAIAAALVAFATWALVQGAAGSSRRWWVIYGFTMAGAVVMLPTSWAVLPAHGVVLLADARRRSLLRPWLIVLLYLTPLLAIGVILAAMAPWWHAWLDPPSLADLPTGLMMVAGSEYTSAAVPIMLLVLAVLNRTGRIWLVGIAASVLSVFVASLVLGSWWTARSFLPLAALLCIAAAQSLARVGWGVTSAVIGLVLLAALPEQLAIREADSRGPDARQISAVITAEGRAGDEIVASDVVVALGYAWDLYLADDPRGFTYVAEPSSGRYWELTDRPSCPSFREWEITGGATLRLCG